MVSQAQRSATTRARLIEVATRLFVRDGYETTSMDALLREAEASKGALYHHFESKQALFESVFEHAAEKALRAALTRPISAETEIDRLIEGALNWLQEVRKPRYASILLEQGSAVLGYKRARDVEARSSLGVMKRGLERAIAAGEIDLPSVDLTARLLNAALAEAALLASEPNRKAERAELEATLRRLIRGLATD